MNKQKDQLIQKLQSAKAEDKADIEKRIADLNRRSRKLQDSIDEKRGKSRKRRRRRRRRSRPRKPARRKGPRKIQVSDNPLENL
jgi:hypothetical protein